MPDAPRRSRQMTMGVQLCACSFRARNISLRRITAGRCRALVERYFPGCPAMTSLQLKRPAAQLEEEAAYKECEHVEKRMRLSGWGEADSSTLLGSIGQRRIGFVSAGVIADGNSPVPMSSTTSSRVPTPQSAASPEKRTLCQQDVSSARDETVYALALPEFRYSRVRHMATNGSFGQLFTCVDKHSGKQLVVKRQSSHDNAACECAYRELRCLLHLTASAPHPNIVGLQDCWFSDGHLYLAEEQMHCDLAAWLRRMRRAKVEVTPDMRATITTAIYSAIEHLHDCNVLHRDLKPENICLNADLSRVSAVKLIDLGSCRRPLEPEHHGRYSLHTYGRYVCTYPYRAPEICREETEYDGKVDVWSLGCIAAELILTTPLFRCKEAELPNQHLLFSSSLPYLRMRLPTATDRELRLLSASLRRSPKERSTAGAALAEYTGQASSVTSRRPVPFYPPHYDYDNLQEMKDNMLACVSTYEQTMLASGTPDAGLRDASSSPHFTDSASAFAASLSSDDLRREETSITQAITDEGLSAAGSPCRSA
eukprot:TRINITY_DN14426_c0_g1_i1.p1 TRINITY_DN14426_c0_g1~~TRINITY_DN14426_c0_g1_i1.p1  ORF type:complete len:540 (+),score=72.56 TRINITY_DN14426_c0_g1_i1:1929-3548(+)